jgi:ArsR family transcriptional regulator, arsenate/arsenite/antimonite-responsive transcriptional repressor
MTNEGVGMNKFDHELATLAKALAHPVRVQIVRLLRRQTACVSTDLSAELPRGNTTVWQHLKVLKEAGIVRGDISGPKLCYCLDNTVLVRFQKLFESLVESEEMNCCPTPTTAKETP